MAVPWACAVALTTGSLQLRPGMFARVNTVFGERDNALVVPEEAIVPQGGAPVRAQAGGGPRCRHADHAAGRGQGGRAQTGPGRNRGGPQGRRRGRDGRATTCPARRHAGASGGSGPRTGGPGGAGAPGSGRPGGGGARRGSPGAGAPSAAGAGPAAGASAGAPGAPVAGVRRPHRLGLSRWPPGRSAGRTRVWSAWPTCRARAASRESGRGQTLRPAAAAASRPDAELPETLPCNSLKSPSAARCLPPCCRC